LTNFRRKSALDFGVGSEKEMLKPGICRSKKTPEAENSISWLRKPSKSTEQGKPGRCEWKGNWSARVGLSYRALAVEAPEGLLWIWIGDHDEYERLLRLR